MSKKLSRVKNRLTVWLVAGFALLPLAGYLSMSRLLPEWTSVIESNLHLYHYPVFFLLMTGWLAYYSRRLIDPLFSWLHQNSADTAAAPGTMWQRLQGYSRMFWFFFGGHGILGSLILVGSINPGWLLTEQMAYLVVMQTAIAIMIGIPIYMMTTNILGRLVAVLGLKQVQFSIQSKMILVGGVMPLLGFGILAQFVHQGQPPEYALAIWAVLTFITMSTTFITSAGIARALKPVNAALASSGAAKHQDLAKLRAHSTDEIGYFSQTIGKLFSRLVDQESQVNAVVANAAEGIIVVDHLGYIDTFNRTAEQLFGFSAQETRGRHLHFLLPNYIAPNKAPELTSDEQEVQVRHRNGTNKIFALRVSEMKIQQRTMYTFLVADVTERKLAEANLREAEARYRDLVETAHDLVWSMDTEGRWTYLNDACEKIYGYQPDNMIGQPFTHFQAPESCERDEEMFQRALAGHEILLYETVHLDASHQSRYLSFNVRPLKDEDGKVIRITGTARDITEQKAIEKRLAYQAEHDSLTGLFNRNFFHQELERVVARVHRGGSSCAIFYVDLDQFKYVNDTLGHAAGDRLLIEIASMLDDKVRESDLLARFGGDEFTLLLYDVDKEQALQAAENFRALFENYRFIDSGQSFNIMCSIGIAMIDASIGSSDEALSRADLACNLAKTRGRNRAELYNEDNKDALGMTEDIGWAARVKDMLEHDRLNLVYQPIISNEKSDVREYEVLMRMVCEDGRIIMPNGFLPAAERFGLIHQIDRWIVSKSIEQLAEINKDKNRVAFAINLSGRAFEDEQLLSLVQNKLRETGLDPSLLTFEITETAAIANLKAATNFIESLKELGCQFALDDFGSGFCSFTYLKNLPVDKLKIDGSFVQNIAEAYVDEAMVRSMNDIAHALGKKTIAEFVENRETFELLKEMGVDYMQGNYIGDPADWSEHVSEHSKEGFKLTIVEAS